MDADGERRIRSLLDHLSKEIYLTPITCSAYGHAPYKDPPTCGETRAQERVAQEPQKPKSRNLDLIIEWILTIVGIKPAFCLEDEKNEIEYSKIDLSALGCNDYHQDIKTVRGILTVFCNPHPFDRKVYEIDGMRGLEHIIRELYLNREIELRIRKGTVPNGDE
jgi:hypothetical protein